MSELLTKRLRLRPYEEKDKKFFIDLLTDEAVMRWVDKGVYTKDAAEKLFQKILNDVDGKNRNVWAVFSKDRDYLGSALIVRRPNKAEDWEIGFILRRKAWGKGYGTEIARKLIRFCFEELNLAEVFGTVDDDHYVSLKVLKKAGMKFLRYENDEQGRFSIYRITKEDTA